MNFLLAHLKTGITFAFGSGGLLALLGLVQTWRATAQARRLEAAKPFLELRQRLYLETLRAAGILSTPEGRDPKQLEAAKLRFQELYVAELSMVEPRRVEDSMVQLAKLIAPELHPFSPVQRKTYNLAHALRDTFVADWHITETMPKGKPLEE